jgi:Tfp pilus assembly protein PilN
MPQQINLCISVLRVQRQRFAARTMAYSLLLFGLLGALLCAVWVWNLERSSAAFALAVANQKTEMDSLQSAIASSRNSTAPIDPKLLALQKERLLAVAQKEQVLAAVQQGILRPGEGHSDQLQMVAQSIPAVAWITLVNADRARFELAGYTLEPNALNDWVGRLALQPLLRDFKLSTVTVENKAAAPVKLVADVQNGSAAAPPVWSFSLISQQISPSGSKP